MESIHFGGFTLVPHRRELLLRGARVALGARAFDLLAALVGRAGVVASKTELMAQVWPGVIVEDNSLAAQVSALRKVLAGDPALAGSLQTVPGRGYCFTADLVRDAGATSDAGGLDEDTPSLVVLPFVSLDDRGDQDPLALGLTHTVATDLSRIAGLLVIAPATASTYAGRTHDARQVSQELAVRYVLSGSVRRLGDRIRVNTQLVDGATGLQVWAERLDGEEDDVLDLEDWITGRIANAIGREVFVAAARDPRARQRVPGCNELVMRAIAADNRPQSLETLQAQQALLDRAVGLDPDHADAHARLARAILLQVTQGHASHPPGDEAAERGVRVAERALALDPGNARVHYAIGLVHVLRGDFERAVQANKTAIELDRNFALAHNNLGNSLVHLGQGREALAAAQIAMRLDPRGPQVGACWTTMGFARLLLEEPEAACTCFDRGRDGSPQLPRAHFGAAIARALQGELPAARSAARDLLRIRPGFRASRTMDGCQPNSSPAYRAFYQDVLTRGALLAGVPL